MKKINIILSAAMLMLAGSITTSCSDFLDKEYDASLSSDKVFSDEAQTRGFLANIYTNLPDGFAPYADDQFTGASRDCMTDNATTIVLRWLPIPIQQPTIHCWASGIPTSMVSASATSL